MSPEPEPSDADLLAAAAAGDRTAFEAFYRRHGPWLTARLRYRCADAALVDDAVQETFLAIWRGKARYRERGEAAAWLWQIGFRRLVDAIRGQRARDRLLRLLAGRRWRDSPSAEEEILVGVEHGDLAGALARLSPELRAVMQATVLDGLSTHEAAALLGIPAGTVKTRAMRARRQLRGDLA
ncbi:RNA polymerase sigma24 factor [Virgisporangium aliadipatigenens]|uniref:RNA polymerase sigma24 factor n=1 Tax=Virgisporangium aliadipatigenens TaxID=741659 RepID=A0A8J3YPG6_9ACTN|nr:RNA polymerase sigma factor [Virgisporangium aliadipatigenens]GIJ49289.1 RNA polymerase sigma24 factor [Virgisporangium aliadipatigenens]